MTSIKSSLSKDYNKILGLDLSLTETGWCEETNSSITKVGIVDTNKMRGLDRMDYILNDMWEHITDPKLESNDQTLVILEGFSFGSKGSALFEIAGLGYLVRHQLWQEDIEFILVPPTALKKYCTGKGNTEKSMIIKEVYKKWKYDSNSDNEADAYVLARIGRALLGWDTDLTTYQKEVIKQIKELNDIE